MDSTKNMRTERQVLAVRSKPPVTLTYRELCDPQDTGMKALIFYDDLECALDTKGILHHASYHAGATVQWTIRPWRLNMLQFSPTAEEALKDAADAHLILFAVRHSPSLPSWLMDWLDRWAALRQTPDAALAVICDGANIASVAQATVEVSRFARRYGLTVIRDDTGKTDAKSTGLDPGLTESNPPASPSFRRTAADAADRNWGINE